MGTTHADAGVFLGGSLDDSDIRGSPSGVYRAAWNQPEPGNHRIAKRSGTQHEDGRTRQPSRILDAGATRN